MKLMKETDYPNMHMLLELCINGCNTGIYYENEVLEKLYAPDVDPDPVVQVECDEFAYPEYKKILTAGLLSFSDCTGDVLNQTEKLALITILTRNNDFMASC